MHRTAIALLVYLAGAATARGGGGDVGSTPHGQNLSPGEQPTSSAGAASGNVTQGMASVQASQGVEIAGLACTGLKSADGSVTVDASGRFSASG